MNKYQMQEVLTVGIYLFSGIIGIVAFLYPFVSRVVTAGTGDPLLSRSSEAPLLTMLLLVICLGVLLLEMQGQTVSAKMVAALGILVAATATLRFVEVAIPGPGGFSPIFVPIILAGYVFGSRFGFLMGTLTLVVSALITGGVGPWLPYQMFLAGWIGLVSGWLPHPANPRWELLMLILAGAAWGIIYGLCMNIYFWPFVGGDMGYQAGDGLFRSMQRYLVFYLSTSFAWDLARAVGNGVLVAVIGLPMVRALSRFRQKFQFQVPAT